MQSNCKPNKLKRFTPFNRFTPKKPNRADESVKYLIFGFIRLNKLNVKNVIIPLSIYGLCLQYYTYKIGDIIDSKDKHGHWNLAEIRNHKLKYLDGHCSYNGYIHQRTFYVHYFAFGDNLFNKNHRQYDEWIPINDNIICECIGQCENTLHKIASANTQSQFKHSVSIKFEQGAEIDVKYNDGIWYCAHIRNSNATESILVKVRKYNSDGTVVESTKMIKIIMDVICDCTGVCSKNKHTLAAAHTQSRYDMITKDIELLTECENKLAIF
eukprot:244683_1